MRFIGKDRAFAQAQGAYTTNELFALAAAPVGQEEWTTPGAHTFTVPEGVYSVCVVCVGGGGGGVDYTSGSHPMHGGGGGGLGWKNDIAVTPGAEIDIQVGAGGTHASYSSTGNDGGDSYFDTALVCKGGGGDGGAYQVNGSGGDYVGDGGGNGGGTVGNGTAQNGAVGGGGAGGYSGNGGNGTNTFQSANSNRDGAGGGGAGGYTNGSNRGYGGGGVGIQGEGVSGAGGTGGGAGGSGGTSGDTSGNGGVFGGGGGGSNANDAKNGTGGAVRVIWGTGRAFPSTNTTDM